MCHCHGLLSPTHLHLLLVIFTQQILRIQQPEEMGEYLHWHCCILGFFGHLGKTLFEKCPVCMVIAQLVFGARINFSPH